MPQFTVDEVRYDFTIYPNADGTGKAKGRGTIPEPSDEDMEAFQEAQSRFVEELGVNNQAALASKLSGMERGEVKEYARDLERRATEMYANFCKGSPSAEEIASLAPRYRKAFFLYVQEQFLNPNS